MGGARKKLDAAILEDRDKPYACDSEYDAGAVSQLSVELFSEAGAFLKASKPWHKQGKRCQFAGLTELWNLPAGEFCAARKPACLRGDLENPPLLGNKYDRLTQPPVWGPFFPTWPPEILGLEVPDLGAPLLCSWGPPVELLQDGGGTAALGLPSWAGLQIPSQASWVGARDKLAEFSKPQKTEFLKLLFFLSSSCCPVRTFMLFLPPPRFTFKITPISLSLFSSVFNRSVDTRFPLEERVPFSSLTLFSFCLSDSYKQKHSLKPPDRGSPFSLCLPINFLLTLFF